jgi:preprotein translocase subunit SecD
MRRGAALVAIVLLAVACGAAGRAEDHASPTPPRLAQAQSTWERLRESARTWLGGAEDPDAALARLGGLRARFDPDTDDFRNTLLRELRDDVRRILREARVPYAALGVRNDSVELQLRDPALLPRAMSALAATAGPAHDAVDIREAGPDLVGLAPTERAIADRLNASLDQAVAVIRRRLEGSDLAGAAVRRQGPDRIVVTVPGLRDPEPVRELMQPQALLEFRLIDLSMTASDASRSGAPATSDVLPGSNKEPYLVYRQSVVGGQDIADAAPVFDQNNRPAISFRLNTRGARLFGQITQENVGRPFAIVLDGVVLSGPVIQTPILGGTGQITGNFTVAEAKRLALLLRAGALPVRLIQIEERFVAPGAKN